MSNELRTTPKTRQFWDGVFHWMKALDDAVDYDSHEPIYRRLGRLEARLDELERMTANPKSNANIIKTKSGRCFKNYIYLRN